MLTPPDESDTQTTIPGTEAFNGSTKAVRSNSQDKISVTWDQPKTEKVDGVCKYKYHIIIVFGFLLDSFNIGIMKHGLIPAHHTLQ